MIGATGTSTGRGEKLPDVAQRRIRTAPWIAVSRGEQGLVVRDSRHGREFQATDMRHLVSLLSLASSPVTESDWVEAVVSQYNESSSAVRDQLRTLLDHGVLEYIHTRESRDAWSSKHWAVAHDYHWHTREIPKPDWTTRAGLDADMAKMREFVAEEDPPSNYLNRPTHVRRLLERPVPGRESASTVTWADTLSRSSFHGPLDLRELGYLLYMSFGQLRNRRLPVTGDHVSKSSPSGGSRHPTEVHVLALEVDGLAPGTYHYSVRDHALDLVRAGDPAEFLQRDVVMLRGRVDFSPRVAFLLTSSVERSMFRYRDSRSYKVLFLDLGHVMQTFALVSTTLGRSSYRGYTVRSAAVASHLQLDPLMHLPIGYGLLP